MKTLQGSLLREELFEREVSVQQVDVWDHERSEPVSGFAWGADSVTSVRFNPAEPDLLASAGSDRSIALYDLRSATPIRKLIMQVKCPPALLSRSCTMASTHNGQKPQIWECKFCLRFGSIEEALQCACALGRDFSLAHALLAVTIPSALSLAKPLCYTSGLWTHFDLAGGDISWDFALQTRSNSIAWNPMEAFNFTVANEDCCLYTYDMRRLQSASCVHKVCSSASTSLRSCFLFHLFVCISVSPLCVHLY